MNERCANTLHFSIIFRSVDKHNLPFFRGNVGNIQTCQKDEVAKQKLPICCFLRKKCQFFFTSMPSKPNNGNGLDLSFLNTLWLSWTVEYMFLWKKLEDYVHPWNRFHGMNISETFNLIYINSQLNFCFSKHLPLLMENIIFWWRKHLIECTEKNATKYQIWNKTKYCHICKW